VKFCSDKSVIQIACTFVWIKTYEHGVSAKLFCLCRENMTQLKSVLVGIQHKGYKY
jgi:hypothetical protein